MTENLRRIDGFTVSSVVLTCDVDTDREYSRLKHGLQQKGQPIPETDLWIAALAKQFWLTVVTRDRHFFHIEDINVEGW